MRVFRLMSSAFCEGRRLFSRFVLREYSTTALSVSIFLLTSCGSNLCVWAVPPPIAPGTELPPGMGRSFCWFLDRY